MSMFQHIDKRFQKANHFYHVTIKEENYGKI